MCRVRWFGMKGALAEGEGRQGMGKNVAKSAMEK